MFLNIIYINYIADSLILKSGEFLLYNHDIYPHYYDIPVRHSHQKFSLPKPTLQLPLLPQQPCPKE